MMDVLFRQRDSICSALRPDFSRPHNTASNQLTQETRIGVGKNQDPTAIYSNVSKDQNQRMEQSLRIRTKANFLC